MKLILNIAGFNIQIDFHETEWKFPQNELKKDILRYYEGFITNKKKPIDFKINIIERRFLKILLKKKLRRRFINLYEENQGGAITTFYQISLIQFQLIIRDILEKLLAKNCGFIIHASAVNHHGQAFIFTGKSFSGKSTAMKFLHPSYKALADDTVIIKKEADQFFVYQTPFIEKEDWVKKNSQRYLLEKLFFLRKANFFKIEKIQNKDSILTRLLKQIWIEGQYGKRQLKYLVEFVAKFPNFYFLYFAKDKDRLRELFKLTDRETKLV